MIRYAFAATLLLLASPAFAETIPTPPTPPAFTIPRTIDMTTVIVEETGRPVQDCDTSKPAPDLVKDCTPLTLGHAAAHALFFGRYPGEDGLSADTKWARGALAERIRNDKDATLSAEEVTTIKKLLGRFYAPLIVAQAFPLLDPAGRPGPIQ